MDVMETRDMSTEGASRIEHPPAESLGDAQKALMDAAAQAETVGPDRGIDAWKKAVAADPTKRSPRRELARLLRKAERWNALVEALKDEESKSARTPDEKVAVLWELADVYRDRLKLDVMVAGTLNSILAQQPDNLGVLDQLATQYDAMKRWPDLVSTLQKKAHKLTDPTERLAIHLRIANLYLEKFSNQAEAIKAFETALEIDPDNVEAAGHLKNVYEKRRDWEKLIALTRREIARVGDHGERLTKTVELARTASEKLKKPAVSIAAWADVLALDADHPEALAELEKLYEREKMWDKLAEVVTRQAELSPDPVKKSAFLQKLGVLFGEKVGDNKRAIDAWKHLLAFEPENKRAQDAVKKLYVVQKAWGDLEQFFAAQGKLDEFVRVLERQVETEDDATKIELWQKIALLYRDQLAKPDKATRAFEKVLSLDGKNLLAAEALIPLYEGAKDAKKLAGVLEIQLEKTTAAKDWLTRLERLAGLVEQQLRDKGAAFGWWLKAFADDHTREATRDELERLAHETGGQEVLVEAYERAIKTFKNPVDALPLMSVVARILEEDLGETDRALAITRRILELRPDEPSAVDALERLYLAKQAYPELLAIYDKKLRLTKDLPEKSVWVNVQSRMGQLYEDEIKDDAKAIAAYQAILAVFPEDRETLAALDRIHGRRKEWKELAAIVERELKLAPPHDPAYATLKFRLGHTRETYLGDVKGAIACHAELLKENPGHEGARAALEARLDEPEYQLTAANLLEPVYQQLESWLQLVDVHEIQVRHEKKKDAKVSLLVRIGELQGQKLGQASAAFDAFARAFREDPTRAEVRSELEELATILDDGWPRLVELYEAALLAPDARGLERRLQHELSLKVASAYDERLEDPAKAELHYQRALTLEPGDTQALEALDRLFSRDEKWQELLTIYEQKAELAEDGDDRLALLSRIASLHEEMLHNPELAVTTYKQILAQDIMNARALKALDRLFLGLKRWQDLADNLVRQLALVQDPDGQEQVKLLTRLAELREKQLRQTAAAVETYRQVLELEPGSAVAIAALERLAADPAQELTVAQILEPIHRAKGDWEKQVGVYEVMLRHAPDLSRRVELLHTMGELHELGGDDAQAFATYARALKENPADAETMDRLDRLARLLEKWPDMVILLGEVVKSVTADDLKIQLLTKLAEVQENDLKRAEDAVGTYEQILAVDPQNLEAIAAIQTVHERTGDYARLCAALEKRAEIVLDLREKKQLLTKAAQIEEDILEKPDAAIATYQRILALEDVDAEALDALERLYIQLERWADLEGIYTRRIDLAADQHERKQLLQVLGQVYDRHLKDTTKAIETHQAILDIDANDVTAIQSLDRLYAQAGRWDDLLQILHREIELADQTSERVGLYYRVGQLHERQLKDPARAVEAYRDALVIDPGHAPTLTALDGMLDSPEPLAAAQVLERIYTDAGEHDKLVGVYGVMADHADHPARKVELLHKIASLHETKLGDEQAAFDAFGRALHVDPSHEPTLANLERLADGIHGWGQLALLFDSEAQKAKEPDRQVDLWLRLARVQEEELARPDAAIDTYRRVLAVDGENRIAIGALDRLYQSAQRWSDLVAILRKQIELGASDAEILAIEFRLGQVYEISLNDLPGALAVYREILAQDPTHAPTLNALELLFIDGREEAEIGGILEPLYRDTAQWEKLHKIHEVQLEKLSDPADRQAMLMRLADLAENRIGDADRAFAWWGMAVT